MLRARELSARELLDAHLDRIERLNPSVNAIVTLDAEGARAAADAADAALAAARTSARCTGCRSRTRTPTPPAACGRPGAPRCTPTPCRCGTSWWSPGCKAAGAIRVGKTNVPEFAAGSHTFNPLFGATHNPYRHGLSAGGSSGGAAAALAAGFVPLAEGSDMGGSLRNPAGVLQRRRPAADARAGADLARADGLVAAVGAGADGPDGRRRRAAAVGARRARSAGADRAVGRPGRRSPRPCRSRSPGCGWRGRRTSAAG